jgi:hypothetical protein
MDTHSAKHLIGTPLRKNDGSYEFIGMIVDAIVDPQDSRYWLLTIEEKD